MTSIVQPERISLTSNRPPFLAWAANGHARLRLDENPGYEDRNLFLEFHRLAAATEGSFTGASHNKLRATLFADISFPYFVSHR